jgi:hypothetical protein
VPEENLSPILGCSGQAAAGFSTGYHADFDITILVMEILIREDAQRKQFDKPRHKLVTFAR